MSRLPRFSVSTAAFALGVFLCSGCIADQLPSDTGPAVSASSAFATAYWFRGAPIAVNGVSQSDLAVSQTLSNGDAITASTWANLDLSDDSGNAFNPNGNGSHFTEIDFALDYTRSFGGFDASFGFASYNFPNFVSRSTSEAYVGLSTSWGGLDHGFTVYYDTDLLDDFYLSLSASKGFTLNESTSAAISAMLGYMGENQAAFYFGNNSSGLSDLSVSASVDHTLDAATILFASLSAVQTVDSDFEDALDSAGVDTSGAWFSVGLSWSL